MRIGTPGFVGARLTEGREARGLTQTCLAELTGIKAQSICHYEQGRQSPSPEALELLCDSLHLPERFFLRPLRNSAETPAFFRQAALHAKPARSKGERHLGWLAEISAYIRQYVDLPAMTLPDLPVNPELSEAGPEIDCIADELRSGMRLGFGPLGNLVSILEESGCVVSRSPLDAELGGSCSRLEGGTACILLNSDETRPTWARVHAAHELGHLVMHRRGSAGPFAEAQADRFARAFLMPARAFCHEVWAPGIDALLTLKKEWRCPVSAMVARCGETGVFDADQVRRALVKLGRRGWKSSEPREEATTGEKAELLARSVRLMIDERLKGPHTLLTELSLNAADVEDLTGLPRGYFAGCEAHPPSALRLRRPETPERVRFL
jgi:Zn-dependent peptidase ImmA (M78 family)/transcriptional regulator with XRE-family HTH domain